MQDLLDGLHMTLAIIININKDVIQVNDSKNIRLFS